MLIKVLFILGLFALVSFAEYDEDLVNWILKNKCSEQANIQCIVKAKTDLTKWLDKNNQYTILIAGRMGTGKTTLLRGFTMEDEPSKANRSNLPHTQKVTPYMYIHKGVKILFYDTPGLSEKEEGNQDQVYLQDMVKNEISPDLIIFTVKMDITGSDSSLSTEDEQVMKNVSDTFGWARWRFAMFVLTFANRVYLENIAPTNFKSRNHFNTVWEKLTYQIQTSLLSFNVEQNVVDDMPIFPIGYVNTPIIKADRRRISWVNEFWDKAFAIMKDSKKENALRKEKEKKGECCCCSCTDKDNEEKKSASDNQKVNKDIKNQAEEPVMTEKDEHWLEEDFTNPDTENTRSQAEEL